MPVTKDMTIQQIIDRDIDSAQIFFACGMFCIGCPASQGESLEEASLVHGIDPDFLVDKLNEYFQSK